MRNKIKDISLSLGFSLLPLIIGILLYRNLPDNIPIHFDINWYPDSYVDKSVYVFGFPFIFLVIDCLIIFLYLNDPKKKDQVKKVNMLMIYLIPVMSICITSLTYISLIYNTFSFVVVMKLLTGLMFMVLGNYLPKINQNYAFGYKLPWTLESDVNWDKTHHLAGILWVLNGLIMLFCTLFNVLNPEVYTAFILINVITPCVYSYMLSRKGI